MCVLCATLKNLATDSHKYRAKKDRKMQRSSFRDVLRAVEVCYVLFCIVTEHNNSQQVKLVWGRRHQCHIQF